MHFNSILHPFVEAGYFGYAVRCIAHRRLMRKYQPSVEIRDYRDRKSVLLYKFLINELFSSPDIAIQRGISEGRQFVDEIIATNGVDNDILVS